MSIIILNVALIGKGFSKADIVCISSNGGANQAIKTILEKYDALIGKGFSKADIVSLVLHSHILV